jgi:ATP-binding cassette subfamily F protein 3
MILSKPHMLIMDEPTNHLDIVTKEVLKKMLVKFPGSILLVSHDRDFLGNLCEVFWHIEDKKMSQQYSL